MKAGVRAYTHGDLMLANGTYEASLDRNLTEEIADLSKTFTMYEKETGRILGCFGSAATKEDPECAVVWVDRSQYAHDRYPLFLARTIKRHLLHLRSRYGFTRAVTTIHADSKESIDWIEMLGFEQVDADGVEAVPENHLLYTRAC
jgi:N-acetylglutamate synthase-like GNAT family acetyltransferase